jgi:hypothetical protein
MISLGSAALLAACVVAPAPTSGYYDYDVGGSGFAGAIDIGAAPPPVLLYSQPMVIGTVAVGVAPLYLYVPLEQTRRWGEYCGWYNACNRPVYFVDHGWYERQYVPYYRSHADDYRRRPTEVQQYRLAPQQRGDVRRGNPPAPPQPAYQQPQFQPQRQQQFQPPAPQPQQPPQFDSNRPPARDERRVFPAPQPAPAPAPAPVRQERRDVVPAPMPAAPVQRPVPPAAPPVSQPAQRPAAPAAPSARQEQRNQAPAPRSSNRNQRDDKDRDDRDNRSR